MKTVIIAIFWISSSSFLFLTAELRRGLFASRENATWLDALNMCSNSDNPGSMASFFFYRKAPNQTKDHLLRQLNRSSAWLYGLEGISSRTFNFLIASKPPGIRQRVACESFGGGGYFPAGESDYQDGIKICTKNNTAASLPSLNNTRSVLSLLRSRSLFGTPFWVGSVDEGCLINDTYKEVAVKCLLLDESGQLKSDNCFEKHRVICATEVLKPTLKYVNISTKTEPYVVPTPAPTEPPTTVAETTGTSALVETTTDIFGSITSPNVTTVSVTTMLTDNGKSERETQYIIIIGSVSVLAVVVGIGLCCWACRRKSKKSSGQPKLSEVYSDTADSIVIRRASGQGEEGVVYATPDDALKSKKAIPRSSVNSDTYDALNEPLKHISSSKEHVNVYSHVQIVQTDVASDSENTYDVTTYSKKKQSVPQTMDQHETYGTVGIKIS